MFHASEDSLDDLMRAVFKQLLTGRGNFEVHSRKGKSTEVFGALLELKNPRARLSRSFSKAKAFSPLGELFWYLAGSDSVDFIKHYIPNYPMLIEDEVKANGAYGPRIFGTEALAKCAETSEWDRVVRTLREREGSRNALIQIYDNSDARPKNGDKPCTCTIQFAVRNGQLLMHTHMPSCRSWWGGPLCGGLCCAVDEVFDVGFPPTGDASRKPNRLRPDPFLCPAPQGAFADAKDFGRFAII